MGLGGPAHRPGGRARTSARPCSLPSVRRCGVRWRRRTWPCAAAEGRRAAARGSFHACRRSAWVVAFWRPRAAADDARRAKAEGVGSTVGRGPWRRGVGAAGVRHRRAHPPGCSLRARSSGARVAVVWFSGVSAEVGASCATPARTSTVVPSPIHATCDAAERDGRADLLEARARGARRWRRERARGGGRYPPMPRSLATEISSAGVNG
jgi:hypothetical protein